MRTRQCSATASSKRGECVECELLEVEKHRLSSAAFFPTELSTFSVARVEGSATLAEIRSSAEASLQSSKNNPRHLPRNQLWSLPQIIQRHWPRPEPAAKHRGITEAECLKSAFRIKGIVSCCGSQCSRGLNPTAFPSPCSISYQQASVQLPGLALSCLRKRVQKEDYRPC